jgi:hypothetical protein
MIFLIIAVIVYNFLLYISVADRLRDKDKEIARLHAELDEIYASFVEIEPEDSDNSEIAIAKRVEADFLRRLRHLN